MKRHIVILSVLLALVGAGRAQPVAERGETNGSEQEIQAVLERFNDAYRNRDLEALMALVAPEAVMYGTGADEKRIGSAEIRMQAQRDWQQSEAAWMVFDWTSIQSHGPVAWVAADVTYHARIRGEEMSLPGRLSAVLTQSGGPWQFAHIHVSFPAAQQAEGESFPTTK